MRVFLVLFGAMLLFAGAGEADAQEPVDAAKAVTAVKRARALAEERGDLERELLQFLQSARTTGIPEKIESTSPEYRAIRALGGLRPTFRRVAPELILWLPTRLPPRSREPIGLLDTSPAAE